MADERRTRLTLRELLDDLIAHTRNISNNAREMTDEELDYARQRLEWLADEIWAEATKDVQ